LIGTAFSFLTIFRCVQVPECSVHDLLCLQYENNIDRNGFQLLDDFPLFLGA
jgi:hypothetical protein